MVKEDILTILHGINHPEAGQDIVTLGMVENLVWTPEAITFTLALKKARDPLAASLKKSILLTLSEAFPDYADRITIYIKEPNPKPAPPKMEKKLLSEGIRKIVAVSSAKGGVGKSTVTANLALALTRKGYRVGILDADIYGPSQPLLFGAEGYKPEAERIGEQDWIVPAEVHGIRLMSIGFFINLTDALVWRGPMATNALRQLIHQTLWGELDYLLIDLPPGTGDVHLTLISEIRIDGAVIVSTPQQVALADVVRGIEMFKSEQVHIPVWGIVENMAWFTPAEHPDSRYYIFGQGGIEKLAEAQKLTVLAKIPMVMGTNELGYQLSFTGSADWSAYDALAEQLEHC